MEGQQWWRLRFSFRNATIVVCFINVVTALFLLHGFLTSSYTRNKLSSPNSNPGYTVYDTLFKEAQLSYIKESEEIRLAMLPLELIKRVREIEQDVYTESETAQKKDLKQTAAVDLSKRLKDIRSLNDAASLKALEEWRRRKMERARQRQMEKNGTTSSQAEDTECSRTMLLLEECLAKEREDGGKWKMKWFGRRGEEGEASESIATDRRKGGGCLDVLRK
ncbi:hypothetical protein Ahy_A02g008445 [Arachis hypogaea]|uniref:Uncharacterized protein n=1 Tax=Arachis hypogaea TaxID=3818 RepID=A0A445EEE0_ARAHY|nr:hypothetical protein Ahy_A02g008445 [Arachis hypogaea]